MIPDLPIWIDIVFIAIVILTIGLFHYSNGKPVYVTIVIIILGGIQSILAYFNFYQKTDTIPPRVLLVLLPASLLIIYGLLAKQNKWVGTKRNVLTNTLSHVIRIPVEIVLYHLFIHKMVPELMTFEGRNFDILVGISALLISLFIYTKKITTKGLIIWNLIGLFFVLFILVNGLLSAEFTFQQFGFEQPNKALLYFPYILLPAVVVPIVIYTHLSEITRLKRLLNNKNL